MRTNGLITPVPVGCGSACSYRAPCEVPELPADVRLITYSARTGAEARSRNAAVATQFRRANDRPPWRSTDEDDMGMGSDGGNCGLFRAKRGVRPGRKIHVCQKHPAC